MTSQPINKYFIYCNFIDDCSIKQLNMNMIKHGLAHHSCRQCFQWERQIAIIKNFLPQTVDFHAKYKQESTIPAGNYLLKVNNRNARTRCEICSKLRIKMPERCQDFSSKFDQIRSFLNI